MSNEERARIARENGAKSKGPVTDAGKAKVSANAVKTGEHVDTLAQFLPPHQAVLCSEDRPQYYQLLRQLIEIYQPINQLAAAVVRDIAIAQWQIERLHTCVTVQWNLALIDNAAKPSTLAAETLIGRKGAVGKLSREIAQLQRAIASLERRLKFIHNTFPNPAPEFATY